MRLFIAIEAAEKVKDYLKSIQDRFRLDSVRATYPLEFHLTLLFLGDIADSKLTEIKTKLSEVKFNRLNLTLDKIGVFPSQNYIRVVWIGIKESDLVSKLAADISTALDKNVDSKFHPHITLARIKNITDKAGFNEIISKISAEPRCFEAGSFKLIKSTLDKEGPVYEVLEEFKYRE